MTETISRPDTHAAGSPVLARPDTDAAALRAIDEALAMLDTFASKDMPGKQNEIQDCVNQILVKVGQPPAAG
jgi:hypothetical protein